MFLVQTKDDVTNVFLRPFLNINKVDKENLSKLPAKSVGQQKIVLTF